MRKEGKMFDSALERRPVHDMEPPLIRSEASNQFAAQTQFN